MKTDLNNEYNVYAEIVMDIPKLWDNLVAIVLLSFYFYKLSSS